MRKRLLPAAEQFPTTQWSQVARAGHAPITIKRQALDELLRRYVPAIRSHLVYRKRIQADQVDDVVQGFVASHVIENDFIAGADQNRGKFRTYLLTALDRYIIGQYRYATAKKRHSGRQANLDDVPEPAQSRDVSVDRAFDIEWARAMLGQTLEKMEQQCKASGRDDVWGIFECRLLGPILGQCAAPTYGQLVKRFNLVSPAQASNLLVTAKRSFIRMMRSVIGEYALDDQEIDEEIADLMHILSTSGKQPV